MGFGIVIDLNDTQCHFLTQALFFKRLSVTAHVYLCQCGEVCLLKVSRIFFADVLSHVLALAYLFNCTMLTISIYKGLNQMYNMCDIFKLCIIH